MADTPHNTPTPNTTLDQLREEARQKEAAVKTIQEKSATSAPPMWTPKEALALSYSILVFGLLVLLLMSTLVAKFNVNINRILRAFALVLIIVAAVFLIVAGYTEDQIAPVMGLLGTIAGYLLGSRHSSGESVETDRGERPPQPGPQPPPGQEPKTQPQPVPEPPEPERQPEPGSQPQR